MLADGVKPRSVMRRVVRGTCLFIFWTFAGLGVLAVGVELYGWHTGTRWSPSDINALIAANSPARALVAAVWDDIKFLIQYGGLFIGALAFAAALAQLKTISKLVSDFIVARGPIYALGTTILDAKASAAILAREADRLSQLGPTIREISERIEQTFAQVASLQRLAVSERTDAEAPAVGPVVAAQPSNEDKNWDRLRELWNNNGERLDNVIERIDDKRRRGKFQRMPRTNYPAIINSLGDEGYISDAARRASLDLHTAFMSYKPRNRKIPDSAVGAVEVLDRMLEKELGPPIPVDEPAGSEPPVDKGTPVPA
jgi:hypothetical protein